MIIKTIREEGSNPARSLISIFVVALLSTTATAQSQNSAQLATTVDDGFTIAVVGDIIISYPLDHMMSDPGFAAIVELTRGADATTGNLEGNIIDGRTFKGSAGGGFGGEPLVAEWIKQMGFDIVSRPNNHADDFGPEGLLETSSHLDRVGLQYAGYGDSYWAARAARFYSSPGGRVGMVAVSDHDPRAQPARGEWSGVGGLAPLRVTRYFMVPEDSCISWCRRTPGTICNPCAIIFLTALASMPAARTAIPKFRSLVINFEKRTAA